MQKNLTSLIDSGQQYINSLYPFLTMMLMYHRTHTGETIDFEDRWFLKDIYKDKSPNITAMKATQNGISEWLIGKAIYESMKARNVLYVMPTEILRTRFVNARFNKTVEYSIEYMNEQKKLDSTNLKEFGKGVINFIGSNSTSGFTEFVAHDVIIDERDQCNQANLAMAVERQSSISDKRMIQVSNPTVEGYSIDYEYHKSDMKKWHIKCQCGEWVNPDFFKHVVEHIADNDYVLRDKNWEHNSSNDINMICDKCQKPIDRFQNGSWIAQQTSSISGYQISKLFSTKVTIKEIVDRFEEGLTNDIKLQRFYNGDLGIPYTSAGAKLTDGILDECVNDYNMLDGCKEPCLIGIDVGTVLNVVIGQAFKDNGVTKVKIIKIAELHTEKDIIELFSRYNIVLGMIDARPETRMSRRLCINIKPMWQAEYLTESTKDTIDTDIKIFKTDRTASMDGVKEAFLLKEILLPKNARSIENFYVQMTAPTRIWKEREVSGLVSGRYLWTEGGRPDHFFHAMNYMMMARKLMVMAK